MKKLIKLLLIVLSYTPIATVAVASQSKSSEIEGEDQNLILRKIVNKTRSRVLPKGHTLTTFEATLKRHAKVTKLQKQKLKNNLLSDIELMIESGYIQVDEKMIVASSPSMAVM